MCGRDCGARDYCYKEGDLTFTSFGFETGGRRNTCFMEAHCFFSAVDTVTGLPVFTDRYRD